MFLLALAFVVAAPASAAPVSPTTAPTTASGPVMPVRVLVTDANGNARAEVKSLIAKEITRDLTRYGALEVLAFTDLRRMLEIESARQLASCEGGASTSCVSDLQSALGVPWGVFTDIDEVDGLISVGLSLVGSDGGALARETFTVKTLADVDGVVAPAVRSLVTPLYRAIGATLPVEVKEPAPRPVAWGLLIGGGTVAAAGLVAVVVGVQPLLAHGAAHDDLAALRASSADAETTAKALADSASLQQEQQAARVDWNSWGRIAVVGGATALVVGASAVTAASIWGLSE